MGIRTTGLLLIISGPSGVGKTTIAHRVEQELDGLFSVSMTTRPKTAADTEGKDYYFVDQTAFDRARDAGELLEWAEVFGYWYGTPRHPVANAVAAGKLVIVEIDVEGASQVKRNMPNAYGLFVLPPSERELLKRLRDRKREDDQAIQHRFNRAKKEIARAKEGGIYDGLLVNDDLESAVQKAVSLIQEQWNLRQC